MRNPIVFTLPTFFLLLALLVGSCMGDEGTPGDDGDPQDTDLNDGSQGTTFDCSSFAFSDSLYFISAAASNLVRPINELNGKFSAFPDGLALDSLTGAIDINASETGLTYRVEFSPTNGAAPCTTLLTIGGINYLDEVFVLDQGQQFARPIYNGSANGLIPCDDDDDDDDDDNDDDDDCEFDVDGPDGTNLADIGIEIDDDTGALDLQKTLENNIFGASPLNGATNDFTLYYRISDQSLGALNQIGVRLFYFETMVDVPQQLLEEIEDKRSSLLNQTPSTENLRTTRVPLTNRRPRPPYLVIVARLQ